MPVNLQVGGTDGIIKMRTRLAHVRDAAEKAKLSTVKQVARALQEVLRRNAPVGRRPDHFRDSIVFRMRGINAVFFGNWRSHLVLKPTRPHEIRAGIFTGRGKKAHALNLGGGIFRASASHPGTHGNDFRTRSLGEVRPEVQGILREAGRVILSGNVVAGGVEE